MKYFTLIKKMALVLIATQGIQHRQILANDKLHTATQLWDTLLKKHVNAEGGVNYQGMAQDRAQLKQFISVYEKENFSQYKDEHKKAYFINLYNAFMIDSLLTYVTKKKIAMTSQDFLAIEINDISIEGGNIWNGNNKVRVNGQLLTLDQIEHGLIRKKAIDELPPLALKMAVQKLDPRIHAAVNCAARTCPRLRNEAYFPQTTDATLQKAMEEFLNSQKQFYKKSESQIAANSIVFWYYQDFDEYAKATGTEAGHYLAGFVSDRSRDAAWKKKILIDTFNDRSKFFLKLSNAVSFHYDWYINDQRNY